MSKPAVGSKQHTRVCVLHIVKVRFKLKLSLAKTITKDEIYIITVRKYSDRETV